MEFFPNAKQENLFIGMLHAFRYMGIPRYVLTDNMKSVVVKRDLQGHPVWQKDYESFMKAVGLQTKLCKPRHLFTKGKVERLVRFVKDNFLAGKVLLGRYYQPIILSKIKKRLFYSAYRFSGNHLHYTFDIDYRECTTCFITTSVPSAERRIITMRKLYSAMTKCTVGCQYCFARWGEIYDKQPLLKIENLSDQEMIIYPCCDADFFDQKNGIYLINQIADSLEKVYISISTKKFLRPEMIDVLGDLNKKLIENNKGFVKFSISLSNKNRIQELEPGALPYYNRLNLIKEVGMKGIFTSITLKPILPFIPVQEYFEVIDDCESIVNRILLGGLYISPNSDFFREYISNKYVTEKREVAWLNPKPVWDYVADVHQIELIRQYAISHRIVPFDSDIEVIQSYINRE